MNVFYLSNQRLGIAANFSEKDILSWPITIHAMFTSLVKSLEGLELQSKMEKYTGESEIYIDFESGKQIIAYPAIKNPSGLRSERQWPKQIAICTKKVTIAIPCMFKPIVNTDTQFLRKNRPDPFLVARPPLKAWMDWKRVIHV